MRVCATAGVGVPELVKKLAPLLHMESDVTCSGGGGVGGGQTGHGSRPTWAAIGHFLRRTKDEEEHPQSERGVRASAAC